ncbi:hypothetical protein MJG53_001495 [Ovis ammon polii x Ovis aries]|uniref:Uncharacterized protein n=1 Tax=Ovis ammon polii x Ovis aries TaxID=2918886 RepID=A0ACB9VKB2_9CETA|nr:hypothetical protein MJG53_001495 [Ovis ammon polii x Ovis aries]
MVMGPVLWTQIWGFLPEQLREKPRREGEGGICSTGAKSPGACDSGVQESGAHVPLQGIRGGSVLFHVTKKQEAEPEKVSWAFGPQSNYSVLLRVHHGADTPTWVRLQDKYQQRVHVPNILSLKIENLTCEDSGQYQARVSFHGGFELNQVFLLTVYEPVPSPQILMGPTSITPDWCNVTLECRASGARGDLKVTWENKGLPKEWEQRRTLEPACNSCILAVSLPRRQPHASLVCVVSNPVESKTASFDLGGVCVHGARSQDDDNDSVQYVELSQQESQESSNKVIREQHLKERVPLTTIYSEVCKPGHAVKII